jgi:hypothetical protein
LFLICIFNSPKELRKAIREDPLTHDFVKRGVRSHRNKVQKIGFLGWHNEMCADIVELYSVSCIVYNNGLYSDTIFIYYKSL